MPKTLTKNDLVKRWGVSLRTVDRWIKKRPIPYTKCEINGRVTFKEEDIEKWEKILRIGRKD